MKLKLKALPVFDKEKGAIFLKEMEVVDATVQPEKMQTVMQTLLPYLNQHYAITLTSNLLTSCAKMAARAKQWRKNWRKALK